MGQYEFLNAVRQGDPVSCVSFAKSGADQTREPAKDAHSNRRFDTGLIIRSLPAELGKLFEAVTKRADFVTWKRQSEPLHSSQTEPPPRESQAVRVVVDH